MHLQSKMSGKAFIKDRSKGFRQSFRNYNDGCDLDDAKITHLDPLNDPFIDVTGASLVVFVQYCVLCVLAVSELQERLWLLKANLFEDIVELWP